MDKTEILKIASPLNGVAISLDEAKDDVFRGRILGDGCAIIPVDGNICSPVDGGFSEGYRL